MTNDEIIALAKQAGMTQDGDMWFSLGKGDMDVEHEHLVAFANLVAAKERENWPAEMKAMENQVNILTDALANAVKAEREACAQVCDYRHDEWRFGDGEDSISGPKECAAAIRARGEQA